MQLAARRSTNKKDFRTFLKIHSGDGEGQDKRMERQITQSFFNAQDWSEPIQ